MTKDSWADKFLLNVLIPINKSLENHETVKDINL